MRGRAGVVAGLVLTVWSATTLTAAAAPKGDVITHECDSGIYQMVVASDATGFWAISHVVGGGLHVPTAFEFTGTDYDASDNQIGEPTEFGRYEKGQSAKKQDTEDCEVSFRVDNPDGGYTVYEGVVTGYFVR